ncbi:MAG: hypothetical protein WKF75_04365 [Singulisphaera sp.]
MLWLLLSWMYRPLFLRAQPARLLSWTTRIGVERVLAEEEERARGSGRAEGGRRPVLDKIPHRSGPAMTARRTGGLDFSRPTGRKGRRAMLRLRGRSPLLRRRDAAPFPRLGGLAMAVWPCRRLRAEALPGLGGRTRPSSWSTRGRLAHQDTFDLKPEAPTPSGEFRRSTRPCPQGRRPLPRWRPAWTSWR